MRSQIVITIIVASGILSPLLSFQMNPIYAGSLPDLSPKIPRFVGLGDDGSEYTLDLEGSQIFPNDQVKQDIVSEYKSSEYNIDELNHELLGFKIIASDIKIHVDPKKIDDTKTRVDIPLLLAKDVKVSNGDIDPSYNEIDLGSVYGIYDKTTDKMTVHVPITVALKYIQQSDVLSLNIGQWFG